MENCFLWCKQETAWQENSLWGFLQYEDSVSHSHLSTLAELDLVAKHPWANFVLWYRENITGNLIFQQDEDSMATVFTEDEAIRTLNDKVQFVRERSKLYVLVSFNRDLSMAKGPEFYFYIYGYESQYMDDLTGKP